MPASDGQQKQRLANVYRSGWIFGRALETLYVSRSLRLMVFEIHKGHVGVRAIEIDTTNISK
jgi:hypothetical protein